MVLHVSSMWAHRGDLRSMIMRGTNFSFISDASCLLMEDVTPGFLLGFENCPSKSTKIIQS